MAYKICPECGANLDPGERCDCESGGDELDRYLREQLALGRKVLPMGNCDNFDYQKGCRGHYYPDTEKERCL